MKTIPRTFTKNLISRQKNKLTSKFLLLLFTIFLCNSLEAQGDNCDQALNLSNVTNFCSSANQYTNATSTASALSTATCWGATATSDVWFSFVAIGTNVLVSINGFSMTQPRIAIYSGSCTGTMTQVACTNGTTGSTDSQLYNGSLTQGQTYYIRVSTTTSQRGTFQLCINNFTPPPSASADCGGAGRLCNKNSISVTNLTSGGANNYENAGTCLDGIGIVESNSVWYTWTCQNAGTLTMDIIPANQVDDIDFIVFQLTTTNPCGPRTAIRCSATSFINANASTGMNASSTDQNEAIGYSGIEDAYVQQINMTAGTSYALLINNTNATNGFNLNWGGSGTFVGPDANITGGPFTLCAGGSIDFNGSTSLNYNTLTWNFVNGGGTPTNPTGPGPVTITYPNPGTYVAILNATSAQGCTSVETATVTVNPVTTATFATVPAFCSGQTAPSFPSQTNTPAITGTWSPNTISNSSSGTYTFTPNAGQCSTTPVNISVTVNPSTTPTFNPVPPYCVNDVPQSLPTTSTNGINGTWNPSSINTSTAGSTNYTFTPSASSCATPVTITVLVGAAPTPTFSAIGPFCNGDAVPSLPSNSNNGITGTWNPTTISNTSSGTYTFTPSAGQCATTGTLTVTINNTQTPVITPAGPYCENNSSTIQLVADIPNGTWSGNGITNSAGSFNPTIAGVGTHQITYTHTQGCGGTNTMNIAVNPIPASTFNADVLMGCSPLQVTFTSDPSMDQALWNFGDNSTGTTVGGIQHNFTSPGLFTVSLTNTLNGCSSTTTTTNYINVFPSPIASFIGSPSTLTQDQTNVQFSNNSGSGNTYLWDFGDGTTSTLENPSHQFPTQPGDYTVTLTATNAGGCSDVATFIIHVKDNQLVFVPNTFTPDGDEFNNIFEPVIAGSFDLQNFSIVIYNRWGETLFESHHVEKGWDGTYHGKLVESGIYIWTIRIKNEDNDAYQTFSGHVNVLR